MRLLNFNFWGLLILNSIKLELNRIEIWNEGKLGGWILGNYLRKWIVDFVLEVIGFEYRKFFFVNYFYLRVE